MPGALYQYPQLGALAQQPTNLGSQPSLLGALSDPQFYQDIGDRLMKSQIISSAVNAFTAPYRAYSGQLDPNDLGEAMNFAMTSGIGGLATSNAPQGALGMNVYHGSPYQFEKFDMSKVGTGEGAQAYGHGLYFAENPAVAKSYAETPMMRNKATGQVVDSRAIPIGGMEQYVPSNNLYKVDLPDEHIAKMLDWDQHLHQQPENVRRAIRQISEDLSTSEKYFWNGPLGPIVRTAGLEERLKAAGVPGIKYLDQGSRTNGQGTYNFVVFDDQIPKIIGRE